MKKYIISAIVVSCFILFAACSSGDIPDSFEGSFDEYTVESKIDMDGYVFKIACYSSENGLLPSSDFEVRSDKLATRYNQIRSDHNCDIQIYNSVDMNAVKTYHFAGDVYADTINQPAGSLFHDGYIRSGLFIPWTYIDAIDITDDRYGTMKAKEANMWLGEYYGVDPRYIMARCPDTMPVMYVNPSVIKQFSQPLPFDLYENGLWNWEHLEEMCHTIWNITSSDKNEWIAAIGYNNLPYFELACIYSNGGRFVTQAQNGKLLYTLNTPNTRNAMDFVSKLRADGYLIDDVDRFNFEPFCSNRRAFFFGFTHIGLYTETENNLSTLMDGEFDWITFPYGPDADQSVVCARYSWWSQHFYLPAIVNYDYVGAVIPELFDFLPGENADNWENDFYSVNFYNRQSFDFYKLFRDNAEFDFSVFCDFDMISNSLLAVTRGTADLTQIASSMAESVQNALDENYNIPHGFSY